MGNFVLVIALFAVGCLPKELGELANLAVLDVSAGNQLAGPLSICTEHNQTGLLFFVVVVAQALFRSNSACWSI